MWYWVVIIKVNRIWGKLNIELFIIFYKINLGVLIYRKGFKRYLGFFNFLGYFWVV